MSGLTIGSLFSGIGGLELGLERGIGEGCRTVWQVEQDEYCRAVLAKHWPNAKRYEDVRNVGRETLESVDIICGGFPCQDISSAGKRAGIRGLRSGLWFEYARIIRELRPSYVVVENVSRLLADGMGVVLGELAESGYDAEWDCIPAASVGAPHLRDRVFIVAYANGNQGRLQSIPEPRRGHSPDTPHNGAERPLADPHSGGRGTNQRQLCSGQPDANRRGSRDVAHTNGSRRERSRAAQGPPDTRTDGWDDSGRGSSLLAYAERRRREGGIQQRPQQTTEFATALGCDRGGNSLWRAWESEPRVGRVAHGIPARLVAAPLRALGNAVVPQVAEVVGRLIAEREKEMRISA